MLKGSEARYSKIEKLIFTLIVASIKFRQNFQGRLVTVMTIQPLRRVLHKPDMSGRLVSWIIELSQFNIEFAPRTSIRSQALSNFFAECSFGNPEEGEILVDHEKKPWILFTDGSSTTTARGAGVILTSLDGFKIQQATKFHFNLTNNEAEYEALIAGLQLAQHLETSVIEIFSDSQLVVKQISGEYKVMNNRMAASMETTQNLIRCITLWTLNNIQRSVNHWADAQSKLATISPGKVISPVYIIDLESPSINKTETCLIQNPNDWRTLLIQYIQGNSSNIHQKQQRSIAFKARN